MKHFGDITKIDGAAVPIVDIITGGSPCQDLSIAGKRKGLDGERSGLFMEQIRIIKEMREHDRKENGRTIVNCRPRFMVWENVVGALSTGDPRGEDFRIVLEECARVVDPDAVIPRPPNMEWSNVGCILGDGFSIAWRVHNAQFWGVPQRRRRIALVADFGGLSAPPILFERKGMSRDIEEGGKEGEDPSRNTKNGIGETISFQERFGRPGGGKGILIQNESVGTLSSVFNLHKVVYDTSRRHNYEPFGETAGTVQAHFGTGGGHVPIVTEPQSFDCRGKGAGNVTNSLTGDHARRVSDTTPLIIEKEMQGFDAYNQNPTGDVAMTISGAAQDAHHIPTVFGISPFESNAMKSENPHSGIYEADTARTLDLNGGNPSCNQGGMAVVMNENHYGEYVESDQTATIRRRGGTCGGGE